MKKKLLMIFIMLFTLTGCNNSQTNIPNEDKPEIEVPDIDIPSVEGDDDVIDDTLDRILINYVYLDVINLKSLTLPQTILNKKIEWTKDNRGITTITGTNETIKLKAKIGQQEKMFEVTFENTIITKIYQQELNFYYNFLTNSRKIGGSMVPDKLVIHNTANSAPAVNEVRYLNSTSNTSSTSFHFAVDDVGVYQAMPLNLYAHHAGNLEVNKKSIGVEFAKSTSTNILEKNNGIANGQKLIKLLQMHYNIDNLMTHKDVTGKHCPHDIIDRYGLNLFYQELEAMYDETH